MSGINIPAAHRNKELLYGRDWDKLLPLWKQELLFSTVVRELAQQSVVQPNVALKEVEIYAPAD